MSKAAKTMELKEIKQALGEIARIGQMFIEGDLCREIWMPYAENFQCGDDMDYDPEAVVPLKQTLLRLERLCPFACGTALWRVRPDAPDRGEASLYGSHSSPLATGKPPRNYEAPKLTKELESVFLRGKQAWCTDRRSEQKLDSLRRRHLEVTAKGTKQPFSLHLFVPVKDSMGEIAAALEVFTVVV